MRLHYYPETDSLYIDLAQRASVESREMAAGVVADFDEAGNIVGIDIDRASRIVDLTRLESSTLPLTGDVIREDGSAWGRSFAFRYETSCPLANRR